MIKTYREVLETRAAINKLTANKETISRMLTLVDQLDAAIKEHQPVYADSFQKLMEEKGIENKDGVYNWSEHQDQVSISQAAQELLQVEMADINGNLFEENEIIDMTNGLPLGEVVAFRNALRK